MLNKAKCLQADKFMSIFFKYQYLLNIFLP